MRRRSATGLGVVLALSSVGGAMAISAEMAGARRGERSAYGAALAEREVAAAEAGAQPRPVVAPGESKTLCMRGAETAVARVVRFLDARLVDENGRLEVSALLGVSRRAAELDRGGALPQRMGRRRVAQAAEGEKPVWEPIVPPERICVELDDPGGPAVHGSRRAVGAK